MCFTDPINVENPNSLLEHDEIDTCWSKVDWNESSILIDGFCLKLAFQYGEGEQEHIYESKGC